MIQLLINVLSAILVSCRDEVFSSLKLKTYTSLTGQCKSMSQYCRFSFFKIADGKMKAPMDLLPIGMFSVFMDLCFPLKL